MANLLKYVNDIDIDKRGTVMKGIFNVSGNKLIYTNNYTDERDDVTSFESGLTSNIFNTGQLIGFSNSLRCSINDNFLYIR